MKQIRPSLFLLVVLVTILSACSSDDKTKKVSNMLGIDLTGGTIMVSTDTHSGFQGDGFTYIKIEFTDEASATVIQEIENEKLWNKLPLSDNLATAVYGKETATESAGPCVVSENGTPLFPAVNDGYYFFYDRHSECKIIADDSELLSRASFNFTVALYDTDNQTLFYYSLDT